MFTVVSLGPAILFCIITMLGWGSWANTQKLAGKTAWPFELYYWDYAIGVFIFSIVLMFTLGSMGSAGMGALENIGQASRWAISKASMSGALFNVANILLVVGIDAAGMAVAFPVGIGLALVIGTVASYAQTPKGNPIFLFSGVALVVFAIVMSAVAYSKLPGTAGRGWVRGLVFSVIAGCLMGLFYPQLMSSISPGFNTSPIQPGYLTPYTAVFFFSIGLLISNVVVNTIFMKAGGKSYSQYFSGTIKSHSAGVLGGLIWMIGTSLNIIASGVAGPAISWALGQGATLVAAIWGVLIWKEFRTAPKGTAPLIALMFAAYAVGLIAIGAATV